MNTSPEDSARERAELKDSEEYPRAAERGKFTVTVAVAFVLVPATVAGLGWFLYDGGSVSELTSTEADPEETSSAQTHQDVGPLTPEGTVADPGSGLSYELPGEHWQRLGDDEVPHGYSSYAVHGSVDDPEAIIATGAETLGTVGPLSTTGLRVATDSLNEAVPDADLPEMKALGESRIDGHPVFEAATSNGEEGEPYSRFLLVELTDDHGAFVLGFTTGGDEAISADIDAALDSIGTL